MIDVDRCPDCGLRFHEPLNEVPCDGCHRHFHRRCLNYQVIEVEWDNYPKAYAFCKECDDE